jgi:TPR repeat protein
MIWIPAYIGLNRPNKTVATVARVCFLYLGLSLGLGLGLIAFGNESAMAEQAGQDQETGEYGLRTAPGFVVERYRIKAEEGDARSMIRLAVLYENGLVSGQKDMVAAAKWYLQAAEAGNADAQFKRARFYVSGVGGPMDIGQAKRLYRMAAEQGMGEAQFNLAILLHQGGQGQSEIREAIRWYEQAAFRSIVSAMRALGMLYAGGVENTPYDNIEAWAWLTLAAQNGDAESAARLPAIQARLDDAALREARDLVQAYRQMRISPG